MCCTAAVVHRLWYFNPANSIISFLQHVSTFIEAKGLISQRKDLTLIFLVVLQSVMKCRSSCEIWNSEKQYLMLHLRTCRVPARCSLAESLTTMNWTYWFFFFSFICEYLSPRADCDFFFPLKEGKRLKLRILQIISVKWNIMNHSGHSLYFCELTPSCC